MGKKSPDMEISSYVGKLLRDNFGKGPESVFVTIAPPFFIIHIRNFISPMESALLKQEGENMVQNTREIVFQGLVPEIKAFVKGLINIDIEEFYFDWGMRNKSAAFIGITKTLENSSLINSEFQGKELIDKKINEISHEAQKYPESMKSYLINDRVLLIIRDGILVTIEKELIRQGYGKILKTTKRILEKKFLHNSDFESLLHTNISDIFVDWNFALDQSVIVFMLRPAK
ncbi:Na-translocating system protein MpsC family protein [Peribacillus sp. SCS-37]|uniref:Na-translocating system protein MpsC family protein n=1 Tax=Paraperibacillus esterisolvens TaxID=3115296 RepID=UPI003905C919